MTRPDIIIELLSKDCGEMHYEGVIKCRSEFSKGDTLCPIREIIGNETLCSKDTERSSINAKLIEELSEEDLKKLFKVMV